MSKRRKYAYVPRSIRSELKEASAGQTLTIPAGTVAAPGFTNIILASNVTQGTGINQRIGNRIYVKRIEVCGTWGSVGTFPYSASLINYKQQVGLPGAGEINGPYPLLDNADLMAYKLQDSGSGLTFKFVKTFPGQGKLLRYDRDAGTVVGEFNPQVQFTNPNAVGSTNAAIWTRFIFTDF